MEVKTKKGEFITGILRGFDNHVNLIIEKQTAPGQENTIKILIRGDSIEIVRPR